MLKRSPRRDALPPQRILFVRDCTQSCSSTDDFSAQPAAAAYSLHLWHRHFGGCPCDAFGDSSHGGGGGILTRLFCGKHGRQIHAGGGPISCTPGLPYADRKGAPPQ